MIIRKHPLAKCEECPLYEDAIFVPSSGPDKAEVALVGEAPGLNEAKRGEPFVGAAGQLLNQVLLHAGVKRETVFITNTCLCRPKDNATPGTKAIEACRDRLLAELSSREPKVVMALGAVATSALLPHGPKITSARVGPPKATESLPGVRIIPTFHPAAALYNASTFPDIVTDFAKIKGAISGTRVTGSWSVPEVRFVSSMDGTAQRYLRGLLDSTRLRDVAIDIEVAVDKESDLGQADRYSFLCIGLSDGPSRAVVLDKSASQSGEVHDLLGSVLRDKRIICQNGKFDLAGMYKFNPQAALEALHFDTMLAHYALDERRGTHGLEQLAVEYLGAPSWKGKLSEWVTKDGGYNNVPPEILMKYNAYDVSNTYLLKNVLEAELEEQGLLPLHSFLVRSSPTLMRMEMNGVAVDLDYNASLYDTISSEMEKHLSTLQQAAEDKSYNPNSWQQVQQVMRREFNVRIPDTTAGTIQLVQERAAASGRMDLYRFCESHLAFKKAGKSLGTYVNGIRERTFVKDGGPPRVFPSFLLHGTVTGRLSSRNPNLQNITRGSVLRRQFTPTSPDHVFVSADYRQAELRVVCWLARDAYLRDVLSDESRDIHGEVATEFYGPGWGVEQRIRAKAIVFGLTYGREAASIAAEYRMSLWQAQKYIKRFFELIPDTTRWLKELEAQIDRGEDLISPYTGRHRRFWLITRSNRHTIIKEGRAFLPQTTASDFTLESANRLARMGYWDNLRILVHDSIIMEVHKDDAQEVAQTMREVMQTVAEEAVDGYLPFPIDTKIGANWGELG